MTIRKISKRWLIAGAAFIVGLGIALAWGNHQANSLIASGRLVSLLDRETSKGLKLDATYSPLSRVGLLGLKCDDFWGVNGQKTIVELDAHGISGWFNPLGILRQRWQVDDIHIQWGTVQLQQTQPSGEPAPGMPWWGLFWPYRVHLQDVKCDDACALWQLKGQPGGVYHAFLEITPNGHDFEYDAHGGEFRLPGAPTLKLRHLHLLVRKPRLYCRELVLGDDDAHPEEKFQVSGEAGLQQDRSIKLTADLSGLALAPWLPTKIQGHVLGHLNGHFDYASTGTSLESGEGRGHLSSGDVVLHQLPAIVHYVQLTGCPDPGDLPLKICQADLTWDHGTLKAENLEVESPGIFHVDGSIQIAPDKTLSGTLNVGLAQAYIKWLPHPEAIFSRIEGDYRVATMQLSGTSQHPKEDLSPRVLAQIDKSPTTALKLFFNQVGSWFDL